MVFWELEFQLLVLIIDRYAHRLIRRAVYEYCVSIVAVAAWMPTFPLGA